MKKLLFLCCLTVLFSCKNTSEEVVSPIEEPYVTDSISGEYVIPEAPVSSVTYYYIVITLENPTTKEIDFYVSDVNSIDEPITEDIEYMLMDAYESNLRLKTKHDYYSEPKLTGRMLYKFDSYAEASKERQKDIRNNS